MSRLQWPSKDPNETLDYAVDWSDPLGGDVIEDSTFLAVVPAGVDLSSPTFTDTTTTIWLAAGEVGETAKILNRITTAAGRVMDQTIYINIRDK